MGRGAAHVGLRCTRNPCFAVIHGGPGTPAFLQQTAEGKVIHMQAIHLFIVAAAASLLLTLFTLSNAMAAV
jgi:hypothetical protein